MFSTQQPRSGFLGVITALPAEARPLTGRLQAGACVWLSDRVMLKLSGMGSANARLAALELMDRGAGGLLSWGSAVGLDPGLVPGTALLSTRVLDAHGASYPVDVDWHRRVVERIGSARCLCAGTLAEVAEVLRTPAQKARCLAATGAQAADMESGSIAGVASAAGKPFLVVRAVADTASTTVPPSALAAVEASGRWAPGPFIRMLLSRPQDVPGLLRLGREFRAARLALASVANTIGLGLCFDAEGCGQPQSQ